MCNHFSEICKWSLSYYFRTISQISLKIYKVTGIIKIVQYYWYYYKMYTITWTILKMFNITGTLSHVLVKLYDISSITYNVQITGICYLLVCLWNGQWENIDWFKWQRSYSIVSQLQWIITGGNYLEKRNTQYTCRHWHWFEHLFSAT